MTIHSLRAALPMSWLTPMRPQRLALAVYLIGVAVLLVWCGRSRFDRHGDGWEYLLTLEAFDRHATFDIRPGDREVLFDEIYTRYRRPMAETTPPEALATVVSGWVLIPERAVPLDKYSAEMQNGFVQAPDGRSHAVHFGMYPLVAYPAKLVLRLVGGWEFNALKVTNAALSALALGFVLFRGRGSVGRRLQFALLLGVTPIIWYLPFTGAEAFSWCFATIAIVEMESERYGSSGWAAGMAATQNPPIILVAVIPVLLAVWQRQWRSAVWAALGASAALLPVAYYLHHFGQPSLITRQHTDPYLISMSRTLCLLTDLNVGFLPYVPVLLVLAPIGAIVLSFRRDPKAVLLTIAWIGMMLGVQVQVNWNSDCRGMMRYLVWMLPIMAWLVIAGFRGWRRSMAVACSVLVSGAVLLFDPPSPSNYLEHRPLARWMMERWPEVYNPEFEIFIDRLAHREDVPLAPPAGATAEKWVALPMAFGRSDGTVTKLLLHRESAPRLTHRFAIDPTYRSELLRLADASPTPVYVHPPAGMVRAAPGTIHGTYEARQVLQLDGKRP